MAKITRATQLIFGSNASATQLAKFGSFAAGSPVTYSGLTVTPTLIQSLSNYLTGWFGAIVGSDNPAIEDMNSLFYLVTYQLAYGFQTGIPEWDSGTTYYKGSTVTDTGGLGIQYVSITDTNLNHAVTDTANWKLGGNSQGVTTFAPATQSPLTFTTTISGTIIEVNSAQNVVSQINLIAPVLGQNFTVVDTGGSMATYPLTVHRFAAESIGGVAADFVCDASNGSWKFFCDGTNWLITG